MSLISYFKGTAAEVKHISWPTKKEAVIYTVLIILISAFVAAYLGVFDAIFTRGINFLVK
jgi:preprotein translocase subunit SecE